MLILITILIVTTLFYSVFPTYHYKYFSDDALRHLNSNTEIALTFDDGPNPEYTPQLLDLLHDEDVKATFFVVAEEADKYPKIINRILKEGHHLGLHSFAHISARLKTPYRSVKFFDMSKRIFKKHHWPLTMYRPPWGHLNLSLVHKLKKEKIDLMYWDVMAEDWEEKATPASIVYKLRNRIKGGSIICLHDNRGSEHAPKKTIEALKFMLPELKKKYTFVTLGESNYVK